MMQEWLSFVSNHWYLLGFSAIALVVLGIEEFNDFLWNVWLIEPNEAVGWINHDNAQVLDLRDLETFNKGHIIDAKCTSNTQLSQLLVTPNKRGAKIILVADTNNLPPLTLRKHLVKSKKRGQIKILKGGIAAWQAAGFPLVD